MKIRNILILLIIGLFVYTADAQRYGDSDLKSVIARDSYSGNSASLSADEHIYRANVYMANRHFADARSHWSRFINSYPYDSRIPSALFGMGRSNMWQTNYERAIYWFDKVIRDHAATFDGQEALAYKGACYVRLGKPKEAAQTYEQYSVMFPNGKRISSSYLNIIDANREAGLYENANQWVAKTRSRFRGSATETNALHAKIRMDVFRKDWRAVSNTAQILLSRNRFKGSMADPDEIRFLNAFALENLGDKNRAIGAYMKISPRAGSYYGTLATERIAALGGNSSYRERAARNESKRNASKFPIKYRTAILRYAKPLGIDPRFILAIMKQESSFRARALSSSAARGLLQLTFDTALKYNKDAGFANITADDLYRPNVNIAIGSKYIAKLKNQFSGLYEAIAASYNGGEDNVARWLDRTSPKEPVIFASEVGFSQSKKYVYKVMGNYEVYKELYTEDLTRKR